MDRLELLRRRQDEVEPLGDDVGDRLRAERRVEDVRRDLRVEVDAASPVAPGSAAKRGDEDRLRLVGDDRDVARLDHVPQAVRRLGAPARDDAAVAPGDGERLRGAPPRPRVVGHDRRADDGLLGEPVLDRRQIGRHRARSIRPGLSIVAARAVGRSSNRLRAVARPSPVVRARRRRSAPARRRAAARDRLRDRVEVERQLEALAAERAGPDRPPGAPARGPLRADPRRRRRCRSSRPRAAPGPSSTALSPDIAGRRSISVRNSYSRKSRMTVSRS